MEAFSQGTELVVDDVEDQLAINAEVLVDHDVAQTRDCGPWHVGEASHGHRVVESGSGHLAAQHWRGDDVNLPAQDVAQLLGDAGHA